MFKNWLDRNRVYLKYKIILNNYNNIKYYYKIIKMYKKLYKATFKNNKKLNFLK